MHPQITQTPEKKMPSRPLKPGGHLFQLQPKTYFGGAILKILERVTIERLLSGSVRLANNA